MSHSFYDHERPLVEGRHARVKRLIYRARYTGMKETDLLLGRFAEMHLDNLDDEGLEQFETLLEAGDPNIFAWVRGASPPPEIYDTPILALIKTYQQKFST